MIIPKPLSDEMPYQVRTYDIDLHKNLTVPALLNMMHEAAMQNVLRLKLSVWDLAPDKLAWVLMRLELRVNRPIKLGEKLRVATYPTGFERLFTYRDYVVYDETGEEVAYAASTWLLMHTADRKPRRIPTYILAISDDLLPETSYLPRVPLRIPSWSENGDINTEHRQVGWHDLDFNNHLNNRYYLRWMLDTAPIELLKSHTLTRLIIHYKQEAKLGNQLVAQTSSHESETQFSHQLLGQNEQLLAHAYSEWQKLSA